MPARIAIASRAAGLAGPIDTVYPQLDDDDGLRRDAGTARVLGFVGKFLIHPTQIDVVRDAFAPTPDEVRQATVILQAFQQARSQGQAAVRVGGTFIDPPVVRWAEYIVSMHAADTANGPADNDPP
jgi:citrate lyase subunit beta/citryl-CoA lyase